MSQVYAGHNSLVSSVRCSSESHHVCMHASFCRIDDVLGNICIHVHLYVYVYVCIYIYMYTHIFVYFFI